MDVIEWITTGLNKEGKSKKGLAAAIGRAPSAVSELLKGKRKLQLDEIDRIARYLGEAPPAFGGVEPERTIVAEIPVRGEVAADVWRGPAYVYDDSPTQVPIVPGEFAMSEQFAFRVIGLQLDQRKISPGDYLVCVDYFVARNQYHTGDIVIAERVDGDRVETTCRELVVNNDGLELSYRSSDPRLSSDSIVIPDAKTMRSADGLQVRVIGKVIARYSPL